MPGVRSFTSATTQVLHGGQVALSYQGPLHFGMSTSSHPFRTDRRWKQVHAGLGYDMPLHELAPGKVQVRARSGPRSGLDLEIETPFHRTDRKHLRGIEWLLGKNSVGFEKTGSEEPGGAGDILGQWMLRTNLWTPGSQLNQGSALDPLGLVGGELHGPSTSTALTGSKSFAPLWFWDDHPTDHFHAGAVPIDIGRTYGGTYGDLYLGRSDVTHPLDWIANTEQLQSSVDVHINKAVKPMWDSGSIVSAQGINWRDTAQGDRIEMQPGAFYSGSSYGAATPTNNWGSYGGSLTSGHGLGLGQRILRTNDGTLHQFILGRSATKDNDDESTPVWIHHKKPLHGDLFWNSREQKVNNFAGAPPTWTGKDEVGPDISSLIHPTRTELRVHGAAFASDSEGTIHAVIEVCDSADDSHSLYYRKCERTLVSYNPDPVYDWRWDQATAAERILGSATGTVRTLGEDFREPSLVCDQHDTLHLTYVATSLGTSDDIYGRIFYTQKRSVESWIAFDASVTDGVYTGLRHKVVSHAVATVNNGTAAPFPTPATDKPKIMLRSDNTPVIFFRGLHSTNSNTSRRGTSLMVNIGSHTDEGGSSSLCNFDPLQAYQVGGIPPGGSDITLSSNANDGCMFYDAILDERDIAWAVYIMPQDTGGQVNGSGEPSPFLTRITTFDSNLSLSSQWDATEGLGLSTTLFHAPPLTADNQGLLANLHSPSITTDGGGNIHVVACARYQRGLSATKGSQGSQQMVSSPLLKNDAASTIEHAPYPLQMPGVKGGDQGTAVTTPAQGNAGGGYGPDSATIEEEISGWPGSTTTLLNQEYYEHILEMWWPAHEYSTPGSGEWVIRSMNFRWLSVPSMKWNPTTSAFIPVGQADTISGNEDFLHTAPQLRAQRFHGFDASYLDMSWISNERSWISTVHEQSRVYWPHSHPDGTVAEPGTDGDGSTTHRLGIPGHPVVDA